MGRRLNPNPELEALAHVPVTDSKVVEWAAPAIRNRALEEILGPHRTWIYRTLEIMG